MEGVAPLWNGYLPPGSAGTRLLLLRFFRYSSDKDQDEGKNVEGKILKVAAFFKLKSLTNLPPFFVLPLLDLI